MTKCSRWFFGETYFDGHSWVGKEGEGRKGVRRTKETEYILKDMYMQQDVSKLFKKWWYEKSFKFINRP